MLRYNARDASSCIPGGDYEAILSKVEETQSKAGNPMYVLHWTIVVNADKTVSLRHFIVIPKGLFNLKGLARAWDKLTEFEAGNFNPFEYIDKSVQVQVEIEDSADYGEQNRIAGYRPPMLPSFQTPRQPERQAEQQKVETEEEQIPW